MKVSISTSQNIGIAFQARIDVAEATMLHGLVMTSSPGSRPIAPKAHINPVVFELTVMLYLTLK